MRTAGRMAAAAIASSVATWIAVSHGAAPKTAENVKLENARVKVIETSYGPGAVRERGVRRTDQVIVFLEDCRYSRLDPATGQTTVRERKAGDVIWHDRGEEAPQLTNAGGPYRTLTIELKQGL